MSSHNAKALMIQGTASSVGKSVLVAALCRIFRQDGLAVAPFKSQNMALNSFVTPEGGEIGRAQAVQAEAAGIQPSVDMNPVLLKPEADARSQVVVLGKVWKNLPAREYYDHAPYLASVIRTAYDRLESRYDLIVIEGAGSPAEINLREREIVNMWVAKMAQAPVLLVGDIDRGGVFASIVGTLELLEPDERDFVKGSIINKFRGDVSLLRPGLDILERKTGRPVLGVVPFLRDLKVPQEDSVWLEENHEAGRQDSLDIAVISLPHMSNYDDFDPLQEMECRVRFVESADTIGSPHLIVLPGTKTTIADLAFMRQRGLDAALIHLAHRGTPVIGICGGFQMLGTTIKDPEHVESGQDSAKGLGLLDVETVFVPEKRTTQIKARVEADRGILSGLKGQTISGYEIHMGVTEAREHPVLRIVSTPSGETDYLDGAISGDGRIFGSYVHGLFDNEDFTRGLIDNLRVRNGLPPRTTPALDRQAEYDRLAAAVRQNLDLERVRRIIGL